MNGYIKNERINNMIYSTTNYCLNVPQKKCGKYFDNKPCYDCDVGEIMFDGQKFVSFNNTIKDFGLYCISNQKNIQQRNVINYTQINNCKYERIAILLESPHKDEYISKNKLLTSPAMGNSGTIFNNNCIKVFNDNLDTLCAALGITQNSNIKKTYTITFVNAIQYQCSLGYSPINRNIRDYVFSSLWNRNPNSFQDDLIERLNILKPRLIINSCTDTLKKIYCNGNTIAPYLKGFEYRFCSAQYHISYWFKNTLIL